MTVPAPPPAGLAPNSARNSLKRARVLFDDATSSAAAPEQVALSATAAFVPPLYDPVLHRGSIARRIRLQYPSQVSQLALQGEEDEIRNEKVSSKESGTSRAIREIRREAFERLKTGDDYEKMNKEEEGRLVVHGSNNVDVLGGTKPAGGGGDGAIVLAGSHAKAKAAEGQERKEGQPIRPGGILVVSCVIGNLEFKLDAALLTEITKKNTRRLPAINRRERDHRSTSRRPSGTLRGNFRQSSRHTLVGSDQLRSTRPTHSLPRGVPTGSSRFSTWPARAWRAAMRLRSR